MNVSKFEVNPFGEVTYLLWDHDNGEAMIVDPGMMTDQEREMVTSFITSHNLTMKLVILTHIHIDHVTSAQWMAKKYNIPIAGNEGDAPLGKALPLQAQHFRLWFELDELVLDKKLNDDDTLTLGNEIIKVITTPGHSLGSISLYLPQSGVVVTGDTLFNGSVGRTDLPGGDMRTLLHSIKKKLFVLPNETLVCPGHGTTTTIGDEREYNPFLG